jgi:predicted ATPase/class 3 adenylate cyclase
MHCPRCGFDNPAGMKFCGECAVPLKTPCPQCGFENPLGFKFCGACATPLAVEVQSPPSQVRGGQEFGVESAESGVPKGLESRVRSLESRQDVAERRQLTVMFCDLVGSTALSAQLDPEELREVVRLYQETCTAVIQRYAGHIAQHLGDGLLVYFGYPVAHEDDAQRAVRTGLETLAALHHLNPRLPHPLQVRIGIHTGLVVIGEIGSSAKREMLALGETPNIAARLQGLAEPDTVVISAATYRLVEGLFECQDRGPQALKGISTPVPVYRVLHESAAQSRFEVAVTTGLTPLVGREHEMALLRERWEQAKGGEGQVLLLSGEPGIGKSRLVQELKEQAAQEGATRIEFRCSPYHPQSALYPIIAHLQRLLQFAPHDPPPTKLVKLQQTLAQYRFPRADTLSLLAALLSLPHPEGAPPLTLSPQKQKEKTQEALVAWMMEEAEQAAVYCAWEDLHWADPSTLEVLTLFLAQVPTTRLLAVLTFRPEFTPPWGNRSHLSQLALGRLGRSQVEAMVEGATGGKALPPEVVQQIVAKTDGVPLFVEELTKMVLESGLLRAGAEHYELTGPLPPLAIPSTLHDSLMARLDRLAPVREFAQVGATLGREFSYELIQAVSPVDEAVLQQGLRQLVEAELLYQRGLPPQVSYVFKHALVQDTAYQSLLKSRRQQLHQQIARVLEAQFPEITVTQPELVAHHYTAAGMIPQALPYWQQAGQRAVARSANQEAISHLSTGLALLQTLPETTERVQQELTFQITLGMPLIATKGFAAPETGQAYERARALCQQLGDTPQIFPVLFGLYTFYSARGEGQTRREVAAQSLRLAQRLQDPDFLLEAHACVAGSLFFLGEELATVRDHLEHALALYDPHRHRAHAFVYGREPGVSVKSELSLVLWMLGYPAQALSQSQEALAWAQELAHAHSTAYALYSAAALNIIFRRDVAAVHARTEELLTLATEQGLLFWVAMGTYARGWALAEQVQSADGMALLRQGIGAQRAAGMEAFLSAYYYTLAEACSKAGQVAEGLQALAEGFAAVHQHDEHVYEAELWRVQGQLTLQKFQVSGSTFQVTDLQSLALNPQVEAEKCFLQAIEIARRQQAKWWELRATISLSRLWQQQGKEKKARQLLAEIYDWFTEGFDEKDLQEARVLLEELGH